ncbi:MAG: hypothetical protein HY727_20055 [Candidatus Rokubacteria bacterium]|nr:hypothetical protein [Candidatus Rokubacteria bacterium]
MTAAQELARLLGELERAGTSVMDLASDGRPREPWTFYPGEYGVFDRATRCQFYYHSHAGVTHETGHFHTVRLFPDHTVHLVAISMAETGWPQGLFTVNLWAIGDAWEPPATIKAYARRFRIGPDRSDRRLVRFVNLIFRAFLPEIERLQDERERTLQAYRDARAGADPFEDRALEILSRVPLDVRAALTRTPGGAE